MDDDEQGASPRNEAVAKLASALAAAFTLWVMCDPDGPARLWYAFRLWLAYRRAEGVNRALLERLRQRVEAGALRDDVTPTTTTIREVC